MQTITFPISRPMPDIITTAAARAKKITELVCSNYRIAHADMIGRRRTAELAHARQLTMYLIRETTRLSLVEVAELFNRDHATVIYAVRSIAEAELKDRQLHKEIIAFKKYIEAEF